MNKATYRFLRILGALMLTLSTFSSAHASGLSLPEPFSAMSAQTVYYVSKNGNNQDGLSWATAWNELDQINWDVIQPGATVYVDGGTYYSRLSVGASGTSASPINVTGATEPGHNSQVVIDGQNSRSTGISISKNYVTVSNMKVVNHNGDDIRIDRASHVTLDRLEVNITGRAVFIQESNNIIVRNCIITTPTYVAKQTDGIYSQRNKNNIYENNYIVIYNQHTEGHDDAIQMYQDDSIIVRNNYLAQVNSKTSNAQGLYATTMFGTSKFYNNVVNLGNAQSNALSFRRLPSLGGTGTVEIVGNTVYGIRPYHGIWVTETDGHTVKNNIVYLLSGAPLTISSGGDVSNNYIGNPLFVNVEKQNFHLQSNSLAIDAGRDLGLLYNTDKDGVTRPQGSGYDIGAYEYLGSVRLPTSTPIPSPIPTNTSIPPTATHIPPTVVSISPTATLMSPTVTTTPTVTVITPMSINVGDTALAIANLDTVPAEGFTSAEFTCTYDPNLVVVSNVVVSDLFGTDPVSAINDPQNGSFIIAIAGSKGQRVTTSGAVFTFNLTGLQVGQATIGCQARVSTGNNVLTEIASIAAILTILDSSPTPTASPLPPLASPMLVGQVLASKEVMISLHQANNSVATSVIANADGTFILTAPAGMYTVVAIANGFLSAQGQAELVAGETSSMTPTNLIAGDIDGNNVIDQYDAMTVGMNYNTALPEAADLNNDDLINVLDLEILAGNYRTAGALDWQ